VTPPPVHSEPQPHSTLSRHDHTRLAREPRRAGRAGRPRLDRRRRGAPLAAPAEDDLRGAAGIATPDRVEPRLGSPTSFDGVPDEATTRLLYDNLDFQRAVQAYLDSIQIASMSAMRMGILELGPANTTALLSEDLMDSQALFLSPNTSSIQMTAWLVMTDEPWVVETPPNVVGFIDDHRFKYVTDFGNAGPDRGQGGKFPLLPPGWEGPVPEGGHHVVRTNPYGNRVIWLGFQVDGGTAPAVAATMRSFRVYPLSQADAPPQMTFVNVSREDFCTIHRMGFEMFHEIDEVVQAEPPIGQDPVLLGQLASIGIRKGQVTLAADEPSHRRDPALVKRP
jgi:hypothetical protein